MYSSVKAFFQVYVPCIGGQTPPLNYRGIFRGDPHPMFCFSLLRAPAFIRLSYLVAGKGDLFIKLWFPSFIEADLPVLLACLFCSRVLGLVIQAEWRAGCC